MKLHKVLPAILGNLATDISKYADKKDIFKDVLGEYDELLSSSSIGKVIKYFAEKKIRLNLNDAYKTVFFTTYFKTFLEACEKNNVSLNNFNIPEIKEYDATEFLSSNIFDNKIYKYYDDIFRAHLNKYIEKRETREAIKIYINEFFELNFYQLLTDNSMVYRSFIDYLENTHISNHNEKLIRKNLYLGKLRSEFDSIVFGNEKNIRLKDIYVSPTLREYCGTCHNRFESIKDDSLLEDYIYNKFSDENDINNIFIFGQPGQGKSSFCKKFVYDIISEEKPFAKNLFFVKFRDIVNPRELIDNPYENIEKYILQDLKYTVSINDSIIILDGLDELYLKNGISANDIENLCQTLIQVSDIHNIKMIITSRYGYVDYPKISRKNTLLVQIKDFDKPRISKWLLNYSVFEKIDNLTEEKLDILYDNEEKYEHIIELISQPILLYMIVTSGIELADNKITRSKLYDNLFSTLIKRKWEKDQIITFQNIDEIYLRRLIQDIAFHIYISDYEYIHRDKLIKLESVERFYDKINENLSNPKALEDTIKGVMIAFYFQEIKKNDDDIEEDNNQFAVEFLHKSLMEYMVAEKMVDQLLSLLEKDRYGIYIIDSKDEIFKVAFEIFSKKELSFDLFTYIKEILDDKDQNIELYNRLIKYFEYFLEKDFLYEYELEKTSQPIQLAYNTFYNFINLIRYLNIKDNFLTKDKVRDKFMNMLGHISMDRSLLNIDLSYLTLSNTFFKNIDLLYDINETNFTNSHFYKSNILVHSITNCDFKNTEIYSCFIAGSFKNVNMENSEFNGDCKFYKCNFGNTNLTNAVFNKLNLDGCNFKNTNLKGCRFVKCNIKDAKNLDKAKNVSPYMLRKWKKENGIL